MKVWRRISPPVTGSNTMVVEANFASIKVVGSDGVFITTYRLISIQTSVPYV